MYTQKAIERAIEGGWSPKQNDAGFSMARLSIGSDIKEGNLYTDPLFWQALGKAEGWGSSCHHYSPKFGWEAYRHAAKCIVGAHLWEANWHRFIDHLAEGKDIESFFKGLLK